MKAFEYLACGRVICSSDVPVLKEVLSDENSILLPPEDVTAWVAALTKVRTSPHLYASQAAAARRTAERYTWDERAKKIMGELY
jgi:glycosyltransferase involved in cell wall biosynthesis